MGLIVVGERMLLEEGNCSSYMEVSTCEGGDTYASERSCSDGQVEACSDDRCICQRCALC